MSSLNNVDEFFQTLDVLTRPEAPESEWAQTIDMLAGLSATFDALGDGHGADGKYKLFISWSTTNRPCFEQFAAMLKDVSAKTHRAARKVRARLLRTLTGQRIQKVQRILREHLARITEKRKRVLRRLGLARVVRSVLATAAHSCRRAKFEATVHPAFAPPAVVI